MALGIGIHIGLGGITGAVKKAVGSVLFMFEDNSIFLLEDNSTELLT